MRRIRAPLAPEVDLGIAGAGFRARHQGCLGSGGLGIGGGSAHGRIAWTLVFRRRAFGPGPDALHGSRSPPGSNRWRLRWLTLHQRAIDREVVVRQQRRDRAMRETEEDEKPIRV